MSKIKVEMSSPEDFINHSREELVILLIATQNLTEMLNNINERLSHHLFEACNKIEELKLCLKKNSS